MNEDTRCECGATKDPQANLCPVCKALRDQAKRKAKAKAKAKRKVENPEQVEAYATEAQKIVDEFLKTMCAEDMVMTANVYRKLIGLLCADLPATKVDVRLPNIEGKDTANKIVYTIAK